MYKSVGAFMYVHGLIHVDTLSPQLVMNDFYINHRLHKSHKTFFEN
jgi:hypothetical protein